MAELGDKTQLVALSLATRHPAAFVIGAMAGTKNIDPDTSMPGESGRAERILKDDFAQPARESVLVESNELTAGNAAFRAAVTDVVRTLERSPLTTDVRSPLDGEVCGSGLGQ